MQFEEVAKNEPNSKKMQLEDVAKSELNTQKRSQMQFELDPQVESPLEASQLYNEPKVACLVSWSMMQVDSAATKSQVGELDQPLPQQEQTNGLRRQWHHDDEAR
jgi:hypothetical protein